MRVNHRAYDLSGTCDGRHECPGTLTIEHSVPIAFQPRSRAASFCASSFLAIMVLLFSNGCAPHALLIKKTPSSHAVVSKTDTAKTAATAQQRKTADSVARETAERKLSPASELLIKACDNYLSVNPDNPKGADVLTIKASLYYNNHLFELSRQTYRAAARKIPLYAGCGRSGTHDRQGFYEEKFFDSAQVWYVNSAP